MAQTTPPTPLPDRSAADQEPAATISTFDTFDPIGSDQRALIGYQNAVTVDTEGLVYGRAAIERYAGRHGYRLAYLYVDRHAPATQLDVLVELVKAAGAETIVVPTAADLGRMPRLRPQIVRTIEDRTGATMIVLHVCRDVEPLQSITAGP